MKTKNSAKLRRLGVSDETIDVNAIAAEKNRAVHYICERRPRVKGEMRERLGVKMAVVMTMDETYKLQRDHKMHAKSKAATAAGK